MIKKVLYYHRRRLAAAIALGTCYIAVWDIGAARIEGLPVLLEVLAIGLMSAALVLSFYLIVLIRQPLIVARVDAALASLAPFALLALIAPTQDPISQGGIISIVAFAASVVLFQWMFCGPMLDRFTMRDLKMMSFTFNVNVTPEHAWRALVPTPDHSSDYLYEGTRFMNSDEDEENIWTISLINQPWAVHQINRITMIENVPGRYFHFNFDPVIAKGAIANLNGWFALTFAPNRDGTTTVQLETQLLNVPIRYRVFWYLGDAFQVYMRVMRASVQKQVCHSLLAEEPGASRAIHKRQAIPA